MRRGGALQLWVGAAAMALLSLSCDSRWFEMQRAQQAAAERLRPGELQGGQGGARSQDNRLARRLEVRVYVSPRYSAELVGWRDQLDAMIDDANKVLEASLHVRLVVQDIRTWTPSEGEPDLEKSLEELVSLDSAPEQVWVLGLVGSVPRATTSIHELGVARLFGKHMVLRTMNDAREYDAIRQHLTGIDEQERRSIYHQRKRHKTTAVLLHEYAHTLGVPHESAQRTMMFPTYDAKVEGYSGAVLGLMQMSIEQRIGAEPASDQAFARGFADYLEQTSSTWLSSDRDELLKKLRALDSAAPSAAIAPSPAAPRMANPGEVKPVDVAVAGLSEEDQRMFADARNDRRNKRLADALKKARPLFSRYPNIYEVQELRCQLAMEMGGEWDQIQKECERLTKLTDEMIGGKGQK